MRSFVVVTLTTCGLLYGPQIFHSAKNWIEGNRDPNVEAALVLRCGEEPASMASECMRELHGDFEAGLRKPEDVVRRHCTRFDNPWSAKVQRATELCSELDSSLLES